jgi:hypothetical protein
MAAHVVTGVISAQVSESILSDKKENVCECCEIIKLDLNEMKLELSFCKEIIRVLQEKMREISPPTQPVLNQANGDRNCEESYNSSVKMFGLIFRQIDEENHNIQKEISYSYPYSPQISSNPYLTSTKTVSTQGVYHI